MFSMTKLKEHCREICYVIMVIITVIAIMVIMVVIVIMVIRTDRTDRTESTDESERTEESERTDRQDRQTFRLDFPGNLCLAAFEILAMLENYSGFQEIDTLKTTCQLKDKN